MEDDLKWKTTKVEKYINEDYLAWKMTLNGRQPQNIDSGICKQPLI